MVQTTKRRRIRVCRKNLLALALSCSGSKSKLADLTVSKRPGTINQIEIHFAVVSHLSISFPEPAIPWEGIGGSGIIRDRHTKKCMSPVLRMHRK